MAEVYNRVTNAGR